MKHTNFWRRLALALTLGGVLMTATPTPGAAADAPRDLAVSAGTDVSALWGRRVRLGALPADTDATANLDAALAYRWSVIDAPLGSRRQLSGASTPNPILSLDQPGLYEIALVVTDARDNVGRDTVRVTARLANDAKRASSVIVRGGGSDVDGDGIPDVTDNCVDDFNPTQLDTNGDGFGNRCDPDLDNDGFITNFGDLGLLRLAFFSTPGAPNWNPDADFNEDNAVNFIDLGIMREFFFGPPGPLTIVFSNPAGGSWHDPGNWSPPVVPNTTHTVRIDLAPGVEVEYSTGTSEVAGLIATSPVRITGGELSVVGVSQVDAPFLLDGGTLSNTTLVASTTGDEAAVTAGNQFVFENVTLGGTVAIDNGATLRVPEGLTLAGGTVELRSTGSQSLLDFVSGAQMLRGVGEVVFNGSDTRNIVWTNTAGLLTIAADVTVRTGTSGGTIGWANQDLRIDGTLISDVPGSPFVLRGDDVVINGEVRVRNGARFEANADFTLGTSGVLDVLASELNIAGDWSSTGTILIADGELWTGTDQTVWSNQGQIMLSNSTLNLGRALHAGRPWQRDHRRRRGAHGHSGQRWRHARHRRGHPGHAHTGGRRD